MKTLTSRVSAPLRAWWVLLALACLVLPAFGQFVEGKPNGEANQPPAPKPDVIVKFLDQMKGDNVYSAEAVEEIITGKGLVKAPLLAAFKIQNDGKEKASFKVGATKPEAAWGWTVKYFEPVDGADPKDITTAVQAGTYTTGDLAAGATKEVKAEITLTDPMKAAVVNLKLHAKALDGAVALDAAGIAFTVEAPSFQPDFWIRLAGTEVYKGLDIYSNEQGQQSLSAETQIEKPVTYLFKIQNDGQGPAKFNLVGTPSGKGWAVAYFTEYDKGEEITATVVGGNGFTTADIAPGDYKLFRCVVIPGKEVEAGTLYTVGMLAKSMAGAPRADTASFVTTALAKPVVPVSQPDLAVHPVNIDQLLGENVYNDDTEQTAQQAISRNAGANYEIVLRNDGNTAEAFTLRLTTLPAGWKMSVRNNIKGGDDITAVITAAEGWSSPVLEPNGIALLRVEVVPGSDVAWDTVAPLTLTARSTKDDGKTDSVILATKCANLPLVAVRLAVDPAESVVMKKTVTLTANPVGGRNVEYCFYVNDGIGWRLIRQYAAGRTCTWTPDKPGEYALLAWAREVGSKRTYDVNATLWGYKVKPTVSAVALKASPELTSKVGAAVLLTATPTGGQTLEYAFFVKGGGGWSQLQPYGAANTCTWTPLEPGTFTLLVWTREKGSTAEWQSNGSVVNYLVTK